MRVQDMGVFGLLVLVMIFLFVRTGDAQINTFLVNCGSNSSVNVNGRKWIGDSSPGNNITLSSPGIEASTAVFNGDPVYEPLYKTARIFTETLNYTFQGAPGDYFLRLHFYPFAFQSYNANQSYFSVAANGLKLVSEFNIPREIIEKNNYLQGSWGNSTFSSLVKEYIFTVESNGILIDFIPNKGSFGFVNAIEVIPVADKLFVDAVKKVGGNGANSSISLSKRGIETMYRLNVGGSTIKPDQDSEFWRLWELDSGYMINPDAGSEINNKSNIIYASPNETSIAPLLVYETARTMSNTEVMEKRFNMSWKLEVDPDFDYLVRLHFCELIYNISSQRNFRIYINNKTAADNFDIFTRAGGMNKAYHEDYFDVVSPQTSTLWIQLGPGTSTSVTDALLSGLEVFKLSRDGNLAPVQRYGNLEEKKSKRSLILWVVIGAGIAFIAILAAVVALVFWFCRKPSIKQIDGKKTSPGWRPLFLLNSAANAKGSPRYQNHSGFTASRSGRRFTLAEIKAATKNFDESLVIGAGGFGKVYKGELEDCTLVAIKRANPQSQQGLTEFETEIDMLSKLRHRHLVAMIGFCDEQNEMILVYEFMSNGTLRSHLFGSDLPSLTWKQRLDVCLGAARGLHYLHTGSERGIIHRDVKTTNILLDENFVAKMADFGLSKTGPSLEHTHVSTAVKGSFGYLDPEYFRRQQLTEKSDVYSFGVVLFEVVCSRAVINPSLPKDQINLAEWAMKWQRQKSLETIIDPRLRGKCSPESLIRYGVIAEKCLADEGKSRPTMGEVLWHLEYVLQIQGAWLQTNAEEISITASHPLVPPQDNEPEGQDTTNLDHQESDSDTKSKEDESAPKTTNEPDHIAGGAVEFSQMVNLQGR